MKKNSRTTKIKINKRKTWIARLSRRSAFYSFVLLFAVIGVVMLFRSFAATSLPTSKMGVFRGSQKPDDVANYETWLGRPVAYALTFTGREPDDSSTPWQKIDNPGSLCDKWANSNYSPIISAAILPTNKLSLAAGARGDYNQHWKNFAEVLVSKGCGSDIIRLGWEFNGGFYPWSIWPDQKHGIDGGPNANADYAAYWRQIVNTMRSVKGQQFKFDWCVLRGKVTTEVTQAYIEGAYPGDQYVDIIGSDAYDNGQVNKTPESRWQSYLTEPAGLQWQRDFAKKHNKTISYPEWGVVKRDDNAYGGGDNPYYIQKMYDWMTALPANESGSLAYQSYFEDYDDMGGIEHRLMIDKFPNSSEKFKKLFGVVPTSSPSTDTTPPTAPANLSGNTVSDTQINLGWQASTDKVGVTSYDVYRNNAKIGSSLTPSYSDSELAASTSYSYFVKALDAAGNVSPSSNTVAVSTAATPPTTPPTDPPPAPTTSSKTFNGTLSKYGSTTISVNLPKAGTIRYKLSSPKNVRYGVKVLDAEDKIIEQLLNATSPVNDSFIISTPGTYKFNIKTRWWSSNPYTLKVSYPI